jgi:TPP-dependent pyruvate/acetoin dehydrogenase alpha subunit
MTCTFEPSAALVRDQLELYRRMWVLRLVAMALVESRIDGLLNGPMQAAFGQEAVAVGTTAALRPGDITTTTTTISASPSRSVLPYRWARPPPR